MRIRVLPCRWPSCNCSFSIGGDRRRSVSPYESGRSGFTGLGTLTLLGGGGGIWTWHANRHKADIDRDTASVALATNAGTFALATAEAASKAAHEASVQVQELRQRVEVLESTRSSWRAFGADLVARWPVHRQSLVPPTLPE